MPAEELAIEAMRLVLDENFDAEMGTRLYEIEQEVALHEAKAPSSALFQLGVISTQVDTILATIPEANPELPMANKAARDVNRMLASVMAFIRSRAGEDEETAQRVIAKHYLPKLSTM